MGPFRIKQLQDLESIFQHLGVECSTGNSEVRIKEAKTALERQMEESLEVKARCLAISFFLEQVKAFLAENKQVHKILVKYH